MHKKTPSKTPFPFSILLFAFALSVATGLVSYYWVSQNAAPSKENNNPNVVPLPSIPRADWRPTPPSKIEHYAEAFVFPEIKKHAQTISNCYFQYKGSRARPTRGGVITLDFSIRPTGKVEKTAIFRSEIPIKSIERCIVNSFKKIVFQPHKQSKPIQLQYPFFFRS